MDLSAYISAMPTVFNSLGFFYIGAGISAIGTADIVATEFIPLKK